MDKRYFINVVLIFIAWMIGSFVVHGALLHGQYSELTHMFRSDEESQQYFHFMLLGHVFLAGAFTWIYRQGIRYANWVVQGIRFGVAIAFLAVIPTYMIYYAVQPMPGMLVIKQIVFEGVLIIILGLFVAFLYRKQAIKT